MKKFTFNLQSVLDHRLLLEEREQEKLLKIQQEIALAEAGRQRLRNEIHELRLQISQPEPGEVHVEKVLQVTRYVGKLEADVAALTRKLAQLEQEQRSQSQVFLEARRKREVLENLKDKNLNQYQRELSAMEQKLLDELSAGKFAPQDEQNLPAGKH
jgi:flagellar protein FliJ